MRNQTLKTVLFSSLAIIALAMAWGFRQIPMQSELAAKSLKSGLEQEILALNSAVRSSTEALQFRLLDVLKAEGNDHATRAFQESPFMAASLLEWDQTQWKPQWFSVKAKDDFPQTRLLELMRQWPLSKLEGGESYFSKVGDYQGQVHFAIVTPVRRPNTVPLIGVGVFPASQFGLLFSAESNREIRVFDDKGFALALSRPSYLGASVRQERLPQEILENGEVSFRQDWKNERGESFSGVAARVANTNLFSAVEAKVDFGGQWKVRAWLYLLLATAGAVALNWWLFSLLLKPLFEELRISEVRREELQREGPPASASVLPEAKLGDLDFIETSPAVPEVAIAAATIELEEDGDAPVITLESVVKAALRSFESRMKSGRIEARVSGLETLDLAADPLQMQTALEEILKNSIEAMEAAPDNAARVLSLRGAKLSDRYRLLIEDTGVGISSENLSKVFDPFFSTKDSEGVSRGLGLNVARRVIEELTGSVRLSNRSEVGVTGTRVDIEWPITEKSEVDDLEIDEMVMHEPSGPSRREPPAGVREALQKLASEIDNDWPEITIRKPKVRMLD